MKQPKDTKHLQLRFNTWWLYYRLPKRLKALPQFENEPAIYTQSLKTDSLTKAKRLRDTIIHNLNEGKQDQYEIWEREIINRSKVFSSDNPQLNNEFTYENILVDSIIDKAGKREGLDENGHPRRLTELEELKLSVIAGRKPDKQKQLRFITEKVLNERKANGQAPKTVLKIRRAVDWFLEHIIQDDIDITLIKYDQVHDFITNDLNKGVSSSTLNGHLYGLRQIWDRARQSQMVSGDNPFSTHKIRKVTQSYDSFSHEEVLALYQAANEDMRVLIHAAATTGARLNELLTAEVKKPAKVDFPCWLFMFKNRGKTEQSTRAVPLHSSLQLNEGFKFKLSDRTVTRQFKELVDATISNTVNELTGKPRKLSFHSFRSTVITELTVCKGINEKVVGAVTGHLAGSTKVGSIRTYINPNDLQSIRKTVDQITWLDTGTGQE